MAWLRRLRFRLKTLVGRPGLEEQLDEELLFHLEMQTAANMQLGMAPGLARARAQRQFGSVAQHKDDYRDRWGARHLETLAQDLRMGMRHASSHLGTSIAIVVALALGLGVSTAVFSVFHAVLVRPLPYVDADRLVRLQARIPSQSEERLFSAPEIRDLRASTSTLDAIAEFHFMYFILLDCEQPQRVSAGVVSANFFNVAGVSPLIGRLLNDDDERPGAPTTIVLSHRYWQRGFAADPGIVGRVVQMNDHAHTIVGVLPPLPDFPEEADIYLPTAACPVRASVLGDTSRTMNLVSAIGRLRQSIPADSSIVTADLARIADRLVEEYPGTYVPTLRPTLSAVPVVDELTDRFRPTLSVLVASAAFLFLSLCSSTCALMLANALRRRRQLAMQVALGAWRGRLFRQGAAESLILSSLGAIAGLAVAAAILPPLVTLAARFTVRASEIRFDRTTLLFGLCVAGVITLLFGLVPILAAAGPTSGVRPFRLERFRSSARHPIFKALIITQIAVSFALLIGAALTVRTVVNLDRIETGYPTSNLTTFRLPADFFKYESAQSRVALFEQLRRSLLTIDGIEAVSISGALPFVSSDTIGEDLVETRGLSHVSLTPALLQTVSPGHFGTLHLPILEGRDFSAADVTDTPPVAIVNRELAQRYFGAASPLGRQIRIQNEEWVTIVGVAAGARQRVNEAPRDEVFRPIAQLPFVDRVGQLVQARFFVRSAMPSERLEALLRDEIARIDPHQPIDDVITLERAREQSVAPFRLTATLLAIFAAVALAISIVGVGGVVGASASSRTHEFGVRLALGATRRDLVFAVLREGLNLGAWGLAGGLALAWALSRALRSLLFEVPPHDVPTFVGVAVVLVAIILMACAVPARRAGRVDPHVALRAI